MSLPTFLRVLSLEPFEPFHRASLHNLRFKTVFLVAIFSGHRIHYSCSVCSFRTFSKRFWEPLGVRLVPKPDFIAKNQTSSSPSVEIFLPSISSFSSIEEDKV